MLTWTFAAGAWLLAGIAPLCLFYFLRMRFRRQPVPSAYIWMRLVAKNRGGRRLQARSVLLFLLQVLIFSCLVLAVMGPHYQNVELRKPGTVFLLDASASMRALNPSTGRSRFDEARDLAITRIQAMDSRAEVAAFLCGADAKFLGVASGNKESLIAAIRAASPGYSSFDESAAASVIAAWMLKNPGPWAGYLASDGGSDQGGRAFSTLFSGAFEWSVVGQDVADMGLGELRISGNQARFNTYNSTALTENLRVRLSGGKAVLADATVEFPAGTSSHAFELPAAAAPGGYSLALVGNRDSFSEDDAAYFAQNEDPPLRVVLVGRAYPFYSALFSEPLFSFSSVGTWSPAMDASAYDLVVSDSLELPAGFPANTISFASIPRGAPLKAAGRIEGSLESPSPGRGLMRHNDWNGVGVYDAAYFTTGAGVESVGTIKGKTVVAAWEDGVYRRAAFGTDFAHSELGLSWALPVFVRNFVEWTFPQWGNPLAWTFEAGQTHLMRLGKSWKTDAAFDLARNGSLSNLGFRIPGTHAWQDGGARGYAAVNLAAGERNLVPRPLVVPSGTAALEMGRAETDTSLVPFLVALGLLSLCAEWILWRGLPLSPVRRSEDTVSKKARSRRVPG